MALSKRTIEEPLSKRTVKERLSAVRSRDKRRSGASTSKRKKVASPSPSGSLKRETGTIGPGASSPLEKTRAIVVRRRKAYRPARRKPTAKK